MQVNNIRRVLIVDYTGGSAVTAGSAASKVTIPVGQAAVVASRNGNVILDNSTVASHRYVKVAYHSPSEQALVFSPEIDAMNVTHYIGDIATVDTNQVHYIGYNTSSGSIVASNSSYYNISLELVGTSASDFMTSHFKHFTHYSSSSATQATIAKGLVESATSQFKFSTPPVSVELVNDGSITAFAGGAGYKNMSVVQDSDIVTFSTAHGLSSGTWIKIAGVAYYVYSVPTTTTIQLNIPYQGETCTVISTGATTAVTATVGDGSAPGTSANVTLSAAHGLTADTFCKIYLGGTLYSCVAGGTSDTTDITLYSAIAEASTVSIAGNGYYASTPTNWGIKITGREREWKLGMKPFSKVTFNVRMNTTFGETTSTASAVASLGKGMGKKVAEDEYICQGEGTFYRSEPNIPSPTFRTDADKDKLYSQLYIRWNSTKQNATGYTINLPQELVIYAESSQDKYDTLAAGNVDTCMIDNTTGVADVLDVLIVTTYSKGTAQDGNI